jgi:hypothetical protein
LCVEVDGSSRVFFRERGRVAFSAVFFFSAFPLFDILLCEEGGGGECAGYWMREGGYTVQGPVDLMVSRKLSN